MLFDAFQLTTWCLITIFAVVYAVASGARDERETVFGGKDKASLCLPTGEDNLSSDEQIMAAINNAAKYTQFEFSPRILECLKVYQNNVHHLEGWLYNHVILMLLALRYFGRSLTETQYRMLEPCNFLERSWKTRNQERQPEESVGGRTSSKHRLWTREEIRRDVPRNPRQRPRGGLPH